MAESRCPSCGYTKEDAQIHMDHHLCKNAGDAPWEKHPKTAAPEAESRKCKCRGNAVKYCTFCTDFHQAGECCGIPVPPAVPPAQEEACKCPLGCECYHHAQPSPQAAGAEPEIITRKDVFCIGDNEAHPHLHTFDIRLRRMDAEGKKWEVAAEVELAALRKSQQECVEALTRAERKLRAYVGVCKGDKELTNTVLPMRETALANAAKLEGK